MSLVVLAALVKSVLKLIEEIFIPFYVGNFLPKQTRPKKTKK
jgi:hypothetical protein